MAVFPEAEGLSEGQMQQIAREFNFSESSFVFPAERGNTAKVRIFTPKSEMPFAGHPNIGTAFVLATIGKLGTFETTKEVVFEEIAGDVPLTIQKREESNIWCELEAPENFTTGTIVPTQKMASVISLAEEDIIVSTHPPQVASVGAPFLFIELKNVEALGRAKVNLEELASLADEGIRPELHLYTHIQGDVDIRARMFAPLNGIIEDPATGSANCALAGLLSFYNSATAGEFRWRILQGVEMERPSFMETRTEKREGQVNKTWIGGSSVMVSEGLFNLD